MKITITIFKSDFVLVAGNLEAQDENDCQILEGLVEARKDLTIKIPSVMLFNGKVQRVQFSIE